MKSNLLTAILLSLICLLKFTGCNKLNKKQNYQALNFEKIQVEESKVINNSFLFNFPMQMEKSDSLIFILDRCDSKFFHVFDTTGVHLKSFGNIGNGPGELLNTEMFSLSADKKNIYAYDVMRKKIIGYDIAAIMNDRHYYREISVDYDLLPKGSAPMMIMDAISFDDDGTFLLVGNQDKLRFGFLRQDRILSAYNEYPDCMDCKNMEELWSVFNYSARWKFSPDRSRFVNATYIGAVLEIFEVNSNFELIPARSLLIYYPEYGISQGAVPVCVTGVENTQFGFVDIALSDQYVFTLLHRQGDQECPDIISVLNWEGEPVCAYQTDKRMELLTIDEQSNRIYVITEDEESGYELSYLNIDLPI